jgi:nucleoside-diphosphate-sugar epimerase
MRVFVTGASGFIGTAVVPELINNGHQVLGLARSPEKAEALETLGADVRLGTLADLDVLRGAASDSDGVIHLAFDHDVAFRGGYADAAATDLDAIEAFGAALEGSDRPLVIASGVAGASADRPLNENDRPDPSMPRVASAAAALQLADMGVRSCVLRLSPTVHGEGDAGFIHTLASIAKNKGVAGYVDDGSNRWSAVHRYDAARLFRLAVESAPAGSVVHGIAENGVPTRDIAERFGKHLGVPVQSIERDRALDHFGFVGLFYGSEASADNAITKELLGWEPSEIGLLEDLDLGHYFAAI